MVLTADSKTTSTTNIALSLIDAWEGNPAARVKRDAAFHNLMGSIQRCGLLQPIGVVPVGDRYVIYDGHRRLEVARTLEWYTIPCFVQPKGSDVGALVIAANTGTKPFGGQAMAYDPALIEWVAPSQARQFRAAMVALGDQFGPFAKRYGPRSYRVAKRVSRLTRLDVGDVLRWMLGRDEGIVRAMEQAVKSEPTLARLRTAIENNAPLVISW